MAASAPGDGMAGKQTSELMSPETGVQDALLHATSYDNWISIQTDPKGLNKMQRDGISLTRVPKQRAEGEQPGSPATSIASAPEAGPKGVERAEVLIFIDKEKAARDGVMFFDGDGDGANDPATTVVTKGVSGDGYLPAKYFDKVVDMKTKVTLWQNDEREAKSIHDEHALRLPRIDLHTHILPRDMSICKTFKEPGYVFLEMLDKYQGQRANMMKTKRGGGEAEFFRQVRCNCYSCEKRLGEMDDTSVDVQVLSTVPVMFSYWTKDKGDAVALARHINDDLAACVKSAPKRFLALGHVPMQFPEECVPELRRMAKLPGMRGIQIGSHIDLHHPEDQGKPNNVELSDPRLYPVWEECEKLGLAVFVHPWDMMGSSEVGKYWLPWLVGMPAETSRGICHFLFSGVLDKFPALNVCFAHGGGSFPYTAGRIEHGWTCRPDLCAVDSTQNPSDYLAQGASTACDHCGEQPPKVVCDDCGAGTTKSLCSACDTLLHARGKATRHVRRDASAALAKSSRFWVDSLVHDPRALDFVLKIMGEDRVVLGSDYPFPLGEWHPGQMICSHESLSLESKARLLHRNACEFLNVKIEDFVDVNADGLKATGAGDFETAEAAAAPAVGIRKRARPEESGV